MITHVTLAVSHYWPGPGTGLNNLWTWMQHLLWVEDVANAPHQPALIAQYPGGPFALIAVLWASD